MGRGPEEHLSSKRDKNHVLFGGTKILQHTPDKVFHFATFNFIINFNLNFTINIFYFFSDFSHENSRW